jgi:vacuolar iron transporter family protein
MDLSSTYRNPASHHELHNPKSSEKLNWLRAAVLGANDGIVSVSAVIVGVAGTTGELRIVLIAGIAATVAGSLSMAVGEYISVSTQRDTERALLAKEKWEIENKPEQELAELASIYEGKGLSRQTALIVAQELTDHDAFAAHVDAELGIDPHNLTNPWHAAYASAAAFLCGAIIPLITIALLPSGLRIIGTFIAVLVALIVTGVVSAYAGGASKLKATTRVVLGGMLAMIITFGIGKLFGVSGI